jgi:hypothetical protein
MAVHSKKNENKTIKRYGIVTTSGGEQNESIITRIWLFRFGFVDNPAKSKYHGLGISTEINNSEATTRQVIIIYSQAIRRLDLECGERSRLDSLSVVLWALRSF